MNEHLRTPRKYLTAVWRSDINDGFGAAKMMNDTILSPEYIASDVSRFGKWTFGKHMEGAKYMESQ